AHHRQAPQRRDRDHRARLPRRHHELPQPRPAWRRSDRPLLSRAPGWRRPTPRPAQSPPGRHGEHMLLAQSVGQEMAEEATGSGGDRFGRAAKELPAPLTRFFLEMGRFVQMAGRMFAWTPRPPYDWRELLRQMVTVGVASTPVVLLTNLFT